MGLSTVTRKIPGLMDILTSAKLTTSAWVGVAGATVKLYAEQRHTSRLYKEQFSLFQGTEGIVHCALYIVHYTLCIINCAYQLYGKTSPSTVLFSFLKFLFKSRFYLNAIIYFV